MLYFLNYCKNKCCNENSVSKPKDSEKAESGTPTPVSEMTDSKAEKIANEIVQKVNETLPFDELSNPAIVRIIYEDELTTDDTYPGIRRFSADG